jgi:hypothetical protein
VLVFLKHQADVPQSQWRVKQQPDQLLPRADCLPAHFGSGPQGRLDWVGRILRADLDLGDLFQV